jgi:hypothetical protein
MLKAPKMLTTHRPMIYGLLFSPTIPLIALALVSIIINGNPGEIIWASGIVLPVSYITCFVIGLPIIIYLRRKNLNKIYHYALSGLAASIVPIFLVLIYPFLPILKENLYRRGGILDAAPALFQVGFVMAICGMLVSSTYWLVTRPDKA